MERHGRKRKEARRECGGGGGGKRGTINPRNYFSGETQWFVGARDRAAQQRTAAEKGETKEGALMGQKKGIRERDRRPGAGRDENGKCHLEIKYKKESNPREGQGKHCALGKGEWEDPGGRNKIPTQGAPLCKEIPQGLKGRTPSRFLV